MKKHILVLLVPILALFLASAGFVFAQSQNGSISGVVTDESGAVVPGAQVVVTNVATGAKRTTVSTGAGAYTVQQLSPQDYTLDITAAGFGPSQAKLNVTVGSSNTVNVKLAVGTNAVSVDVAANSLSGINLENAENSQVINTKQILELPTQTRNPYDLVALSGSVSSDPSGSGRGVGGFNISGARDASTDVLLDGMENTALFAAGVATPIPLDATQEFRILTSNFGPEYGRASGGIVNVVTKAGTNAFHGTAYEFYRPSTFASNGYYNNANGIRQHRFVRNNFGYSIGGPVLHDKLFFSSTEWLRVRSSNVVQYYIPTPGFLAASNKNTQDFFTKFGKVTGTPTGTVVTVGQLASQGFTTDAATLQTVNPTLFNDSFPVLQQVNVTVPVDAGGGTPVNQYNTIERLDYNLSSRTQMYARYVYYTSTQQLGGGNNSPYAGYNTANQTLVHNGVFGLTHTFSPRLTSQTQFAVLRYTNDQPLGANPAGPTLYVNSSAAPTINGNGNLVFPGYSANNAGSGIPSGGPQNDIQVSPVFTYVRGAHTLTFGGQYTYIRDNHTFGIYENATESLVVSGTNGAIANLQAGNSSYFQASLSPQGAYPCVRDLATGLIDQTPACTLTTPISQPNFSRSNRYHEGAGFFNDSWKTSPRLTLNLGLRYELYGTQHNKNPNLDSNFYFGTSGTLADRIRNGKILRATDTAPPGVENPGGKLWNTNYKQFAPRIGLAYDLTGDGKTSLRAGYGISYERNFGNVTYNVALNPPAVAAVSFTTADTGGPIPISTGVLGQFSGVAGVSKALSPTTVRAVNPTIAPAYNQFYTLSVERQVSNNTAVSVSYTGERGIHNYSIANYNRSYYGQVYEGDSRTYAAPNAGAKNSNRLNPQYTSINIRGADGDSYYNGLNTSVRSNNLFHQGLTITANYTYSHSLDNTSSTFTDGSSNTVNSVAYFDPFNKGLDHGNSDFDQKHRVTAGLVWTLPYFDRTTGFSRALLDGWELGTIFTASTGTPFTMYDCGLPAITVCPRARFVQRPHYQRTGNSVPIAGATDDLQYITFPAYKLPGPINPATGKPTSVRNTAAYGVYTDPYTNYTSTTASPTVGNVPYALGGKLIPGAADLPTIVNGMDFFPGGMSARNAFRGPGLWNGLNANVNKNIRFTERYSLQLRGEVYDLTNHANSYLILGGNNDVQYGSAQVQKSGPAQGGNRQLQLAAKFIF